MLPFIHNTPVPWRDTVVLTHWGRIKMDTISQTTFSSAFSWMNVLIAINISLKIVPKVSINNIRALVQIMAWRSPGDKPLSEPMMVRLPTHICVTRPQWVKCIINTLLTSFSRCRWHFRIGCIACHNCICFIHILPKYVSIVPLNYASIGLDNDAEQALSRYRNRWWHGLLTHVSVSRPWWVKCSQFSLKSDSMR